MDAFSFDVLRSPTDGDTWYLAADNHATPIPTAAGHPSTHPAPTTNWNSQSKAIQSWIGGSAKRRKPASRHMLGTAFPKISDPFLRYMDPEDEALYLVFFYSDRQMPHFVITFLFIFGVVGTLLNSARSSPLVCKVLWAVGAAIQLVCTVLMHRNRGQLDALTAAAAPSLAGGTSPPKILRDLIPSSAETTVTATSIRAARCSCEIRDNAKSHELIVSVAVATIGMFVMALYIGKVNCYFLSDAPVELFQICRNSMGLEGIVAAPAMVVLSVLPLRSVAQIGVLAVVLCLYFISWAIGIAEFADTTVTYKVTAAAFVVSSTLLSCVTGNKWDWEYRGDFEVLLGLIQRKETTERLADYVQTVADSVLPSNLVNMISRGVKVRELRPHAAVAIIRVVSHSFALKSGPSLGVLESSAELVCILHAVKCMLDRCLEALPDVVHDDRRGAEMVKTHSVGDEYCVVSYPVLEDEPGTEYPASPAAGLVKAFGKLIMQHFYQASCVLRRRSSNVQTHQGSPLSGESNGAALASHVASSFASLQLFLAVAMDVGEVAIATVGAVHNVVAVGQPVEWARSHIKSLQPPTASATSSLSCTSHTGSTSAYSSAFLVMDYSTGFSLAVTSLPTTESDAGPREATQSPELRPRLSDRRVNPLAAPQAQSSTQYASGNGAFGATPLSEAKSASATTTSILELPTHSTAGLSLSTQHNDHHLGAGGARGAGGRVSRTKLSTIRTLATRLKEIQPASLVIRRRLFFQYTFESPDMESQFALHVESADESRRTMMEFVNAFVVGCCFIVGSALEDGPLQVGNSSLVWSIIAVVFAACAVPLVLVVGKGASWPGRTLELLWIILIGLAIWFADYGSFIAHSQVLVAPVLFRLIVIREKKHLLVGSLTASLVIGGFLIYTTVRNLTSGRPRILTCGSLVIQTVAAVVTLLLVERFQRVRFSVTQELKVVDQALKEATLLLDEMLKKMFPSPSIQRLISLRHVQTLKLAADGGDDEVSVPLFSPVSGDPGAAQHQPTAPMSLLKVALHGSYFATPTRDMALGAVSLRPYATLQQLDIPIPATTSEILQALRAADEECSFLSQLSSGSADCSIVLTKVSGDTAFLCVDSGVRQCQPTDEVFRLATAIARFVRESQLRQQNLRNAAHALPEGKSQHPAFVEVGAAISFGPLTGALLGTAVLSYEFLGPTALICKAAASIAPAWSLYMTESAANMFRWHISFAAMTKQHCEASEDTAVGGSSSSRKHHSGNSASANIDARPHSECNNGHCAPTVAISSPAPCWLQGVGRQTLFSVDILS